MDFTLSAYKRLISTLQSHSYFFQTFEEYIQNSKEKVVILRHDVDRLPWNSLKTARLEDEFGIRATYFFRTIPQTFKPEIIKEIAGMGHEIGYYYENLAEVSRKKEGRISRRPTPVPSAGATGQARTHTDVLAERPQLNSPSELNGAGLLG